MFNYIMKSLKNFLYSTLTFLALEFFLNSLLAYDSLMKLFRLREEKPNTIKFYVKFQNLQQEFYKCAFYLISFVLTFASGIFVSIYHEIPMYTAHKYKAFETNVKSQETLETRITCIFKKYFFTFTWKMMYLIPLSHSGYFIPIEAWCCVRSSGSMS